jgi:hypothetical protein
MLPAIERATSAMRCVVFLIVGLLLWGLADDFLASGVQPSSRAGASDDDEYLPSGAKRAPHRLAEQEKTPLCAVVPRDDPAPSAGASVPVSCPELRALGGLYVSMSLQI